VSAQAATGPELFDCRDAFTGALVDLARADSRVVAVVNDAVGSTKLGAFKQEFADRFVNVGIAEQNLVSIGAGLANGGRIPFVCGAAPFLTARALEQIKVDAAYSNTNVKLVGVSSGVAYGELGPTHHSIEDVAWLRAIANLVVVVPADPAETDQAIRAAYRHVGPVFIRTSRMPVPSVHEAGYQFAIGKAVRLRDGADVTIIANGVMVARALEASDRLAGEGIGARVLNMATVSNLDREAILAAAGETGGIVTVEEHTVRGGLGGAVAELVSVECPVRMRILGIPGVFAPTGSAEFLLAHFGLTSDGIGAAARELVQRRSSS
jgi:transketolase